MNCRHARRDLGAYMDGELEPARRAELEGHLDGCAACSRMLRELRALHAGLRSLPPVPSVASAPVAVRSMHSALRRPVAVAAAVLVLALAAVLAGTLLPRREAGGPVAVSAPPLVRTVATEPRAPTPQRGKPVGRASALPAEPGGRGLQPRTVCGSEWRHLCSSRGWKPLPPGSSTPSRVQEGRAPAQERQAAPQERPVRPQELVRVYEAGLLLAERESVNEALRALCSGAAPVGPTVEEGAFAPRALAAMGDLPQATRIYEGRLSRLTATADELPLADRNRLAACEERLIRDQPKVLAMYATGRERERDD